MSRINFKDFLSPYYLELGVFASLLCLWAGLIFSKAIVEISFVTGLILWLLLKYQTKCWNIQVEKPILISALSFLCFCALSFLWSDFPKQSWQGIRKTFEQVFLFFMVAESLRNQNLRSKFEVYICLALFVLVLDGFFQYFAGHDFLRGIPSQDASAGVRISASFKTYGLLGAHLIVVIPFLFYLSYEWKNLQNKVFLWYLSIPTLLGALVLLYFTRSRGAILAFFLGTLLLLILRKKFLLLVVLGLLTCVGISFVPKSMIIHLDAEKKEQSIVERVELWKRAIHVIEAKPLTGTGINTYAVAHQQYDKTNSWRVKNYYAHNGFLQMAAEIGIIGLGIFLLFSILLLSRYFFLSHVLSKHNAIISLSLCGSLINFMIFSLADTIMHNPQSIILFWFTAGLLYSYTSTPLDPQLKKRYSR